MLVRVLDLLLFDYDHILIQVIRLEAHVYFRDICLRLVTKQPLGPCSWNFLLRHRSLRVCTLIGNVKVDILMLFDA